MGYGRLLPLNRSLVTAAYDDEAADGVMTEDGKTRPEAALHATKRVDVKKLCSCESVVFLMLVKLSFV